MYRRNNKSIEFDLNHLYNTYSAEFLVFRISKLVKFNVTVKFKDICAIFQYYVSLLKQAREQHIFWNIINGVEKLIDFGRVTHTLE